MKSAPIIEDLRREIEEYKGQVVAEKVGTVLEVGDGIARVRGLTDIAMNEMVEFDTREGKVTGIAMNLEEDSVGVVVLGEYLKIREGDKVTHNGRVLSIRVGDEMVGRVVNPLGEPLDGKGPIFKSGSKEIYYPIERIAPSVVEREPVDTPIHTGIRAIDAIIPIGRGQRELIIGDRQTGKTSIAIDTIINQRKENVICIYVAIGQKTSRIAHIISDLEKHDAMGHTIIVSGSASDSAAFQYLAPYAGCAIGEYFMDQGKDALV